MSEVDGFTQPSDVTVNRDGRVLIPKQIRQDLGLEAGSTLVLSVEDGRLVLESRRQLMDRIRDEVAGSWRGDPEGSAVDELLADRRAESAAEDRR